MLVISHLVENEMTWKIGGFLWLEKTSEKYLPPLRANKIICFGKIQMTSIANNTCDDYKSISQYYFVF